MARIGIVGVGAVGGAVAGALATTQRHELTLFTRRPRRSPLLVEVDGRELCVTADFCSDPADIRGPVDWVVVAVKTYQSAGAHPWLREICDGSTRVLPLQNGVEQKRLLNPAVSDSEVVPAVVWVASEVTDDGVVRVRGPARVVVADDPSGGDVVDLFAGSFLEVEVTPDIELAAWRKLCTNAVATLEALVGHPSGIFVDQGVAQVGTTIARECAQVARAHGVGLTDDDAVHAVAFLASLPPTTGASILRDRLSDRHLEWDALIGVISRLGDQHGIETPVCDIVSSLLAAADALVDG